MTPQDALTALHSLPLQRLTGIPKEKGIYALADHAHRFRYIGSTEGEDFRGRIQNRHTTGSEANSHKFSWAYNTGRMYRGPESPDPEIMADRKAAKDLRTDFIRAHCRAVWMPLPGTRAEIEALEHAMVAIAPAETVLWNRQRFKADPPPEPADLVDRLVRDLGLGPDTITRIDRQAARWRAALAAG